MIIHDGYLQIYLLLILNIMLNAISFDQLKDISLQQGIVEQFLSKSQQAKVYTIVEIDKQKRLAFYRLHQQLRMLIGEKLANYLESFSIGLQKPEHQLFSICKIYNSWPNCSEFLRPQSLPRYFKQYDQNAHLGFLDQTHTVEGFIQAEEWMLDSLVSASKMEEGYYLPVPSVQNKELTGVLYLIYDKASLLDSERDALNNFHERLIKRYSSTL